MLDWLESTAIAHMVRESAWGYPIILSGHAVGMGILVGIVLMINFRVLGFASAVPVAALKPMFQFAMIGLLINVTSGTMLFVGNAGSLFENDAFRVKIILIVIGSILLGIMQARLFGRSGSERAQAFGIAPKLLAVLSIIVWLGVIIAGRLIAYLEFGFY